MPARPGHLPTYRERIVLQKLRAGELSSMKLRPITSQMIVNLIAKNWIEPGSEAHTYRITPAGEAAMRERIPLSREPGLKAKGK